MMRLRAYLLVLASLMVFFYACDDDDNNAVDFAFEYYPLDTNFYLIYDVDSIVFDDFLGTVDTSSFQLKEVYTEVFESFGRPVYRLERFRRSDEQSSWDAIQVWQVELRDGNSIVKTEDNLPFVKLVFPPSQGKTWDGHVLLNINPSIEYLEGWVYEVTETDVPAMVNGLSFDSTVTVLQEADTTILIEYTFSKEQFARNVGLIYKETAYVTRSTIEPGDPPLPASGESGFIFKMKIREYGYE